MPVEHSPNRHNRTTFIKPPTKYYEFCKDEATLRSISVSGENKSFCRRELGLLKQSFDIHRVLNSERENTAIKLKNEREILTRELKAA